MSASATQGGHNKEDNKYLQLETVSIAEPLQNRQHAQTP